PASLRAMGLAHLGEGVRIHPTVIIIGLENLSVGDFSRIDAHTIITAGARVSIGRNVHLGAGCYIAGAGGVELGDFTGYSQGVRIYSNNDDYSGAALTGPTVPEALTAVTRAPVVVGRHTVIGSGSVVLPGAHVGEGCAIGALSLVNRSLAPWGVYAGQPVRLLRERRRDLLELEKQYLASETLPPSAGSGSGHGV
ncbi:MAG: putative o-acyltransferase, CysE/LacA/LpxA/NodL family, partial [Phenylobacterium sp.]|nr:putative o-acyltransferase, CysE/LacA/LpxA/NodL family [Phenylobacterium sp.]